MVNTWTNLLEPVFKENHFQIWTGDFNALTREDYNNEKWNHITGVRKQNGWELPKTELTTQVSTVRDRLQITLAHCIGWILIIKKFWKYGPKKIFLAILKTAAWSFSTNSVF